VRFGTGPQTSEVIVLVIFSALRFREDRSSFGKLIASENHRAKWHNEHTIHLGQDLPESRAFVSRQMVLGFSSCISCLSTVMRKSGGRPSGSIEIKRQPERPVAEKTAHHKGHQIIVRRFDIRHRFKQNLPGDAIGQQNNN
jgi:hypothetical protein